MIICTHLDEPCFVTMASPNEGNDWGNETYGLKAQTLKMKQTKHYKTGTLQAQTSKAS